MKYGEFKTIEDLEQAQRSVRQRMNLQKDKVACSFGSVKESFTPSNMFMSGLRSVSAVFPVDELLLSAILKLRKRFTR
jgi:hypothetical protein